MIARFPTREHRPLLLICASLILVIASSQSNFIHAEAWTDLRGTRTIDARMIGLWGDNVLLELTNGRRVSVDMNSLRSDSRIQARRLSKELIARRAARIEELNQASIVAAASAPDPLPKPDPAPAYVAPAANIEVEVFLKQVDQAIAAGHVRAVYDSLPPSYRADLDDVVRRAVERVDADEFESIVSCLQKLGSVLVMNQNWLLNSPRVKAIPESTASQVRGPLLSLASLVHATKDTELFQLEKIKSQPFSQWLGELDQATCDYLHQAHQAFETPVLRRVETESTRDKTTRVKIQSGEQESTVSLTKVDGYWVPTSMDQDHWTTMVNDWKKSIDEPDGMAFLDRYADYADQATIILDPLSMAKNANDFHAALELYADFLTTNLPEWELFGIRWNFGSKDRYDDDFIDDFDDDI